MVTERYKKSCRSAGKEGDREERVRGCGGKLGAWKGCNEGEVVGVKRGG